MSTIARSFPGRFSTRIKGVSLSPGYPARLQRIGYDGPVPADLVRDRANPVDPNAIEVCVHGTRLGWLPRNLAAQLAPELDNGAVWTATAEASVATRNPNHPGATVSAERADRAPRPRHESSVWSSIAERGLRSHQALVLLAIARAADTCEGSGLEPFIATADIAAIVGAPEAEVVKVVRHLHRTGTIRAVRGRGWAP